EMDLEVAVDGQPRRLERVGQMYARAEIADENADATGNDGGDDRDEQPVDRAGSARHTAGCVTTPHVREELRNDETNAGENGGTNDRVRLNSAAPADHTRCSEQPGRDRHHDHHRAHRNKSSGEDRRQRDATAYRGPPPGLFVQNSAMVGLWCRCRRVHRLLRSGDDGGTVSAHPKLVLDAIRSRALALTVARARV